MLESKGRGQESARWCFTDVSESCHSPLVLVGAPAQGYCSPLVRARTKCSLRADSSTLRRSESPKTAHKLDTSSQELRAVFVPPITTEPYRWWRSTTVTSKELSLDPNKALESGGCTLDSWNSAREGFSQEITQISILSRLLLLSSSTTSFSDVQMGKRPLMDEVEENKYTPRSPSVGQTFYTKMGSPDAVDVAPDALHWASGDTSMANRASGDTTSQRPVAPSCAPGSFTTSLSLRPDATRCVRC